MGFNDALYDAQLNIKTTGRDDSRANNYNYPYEPTDYVVLERLCNSNYINKRNLVVDFGSGKGRVGFYLAYQTSCKAVGVEYDERLYEKALQNLNKFSKPYNISFECINAVDYCLPHNADRMYFFNPFSVEILKSVFSKIKESFYENRREILMFFYYPSDDYIATLVSDAEIEFVDEVDCQDLFEKADSRERIMIFGLGV